jgi:hypothetical protein
MGQHCKRAKQSSVRSFYCARERLMWLVVRRVGTLDCRNGSYGCFAHRQAESANSSARVESRESDY